jgi:colicin import membrane protein
MLEAAEARAREISEAAEQDAARAKEDARAAASNLLSQIDALERPMSELVTALRREQDGLSGELRELGPSVDLSSDAIAEESPQAIEARTAEAERQRQREEEAERQRWEEEERRREEEARAEAERQRAEAVSDDVMAEEPQAEDAAQPLDEQAVAEAEPERSRPGLFRRMRRGRGMPFISEPGECAVCQRTFQAGSEEELAASGWLVNDDVGVCPDCQREGWQLPEGARLPFRRGRP